MGVFRQYSGGWSSGALNSENVLALGAKALIVLNFFFFFFFFWNQLMTIFPELDYHDVYFASLDMRHD